MRPPVSVARCFDQGLANLKENFWAYILIVIILGILDSFGNGPTFSRSMGEHVWFGTGSSGNGFLSVIVGVFIKPVFDFGASLLFVKGQRRQEVDVKAVADGFKSKNLYVDIILTNLMVFLMLVVGFICLILPGIYIACRTILTSYLVMDKGLAPRQAISASWELMRDYWPQVLLLFLISAVILFAGLLLLVVGVIPAFALVKAMFAAFYQKIIDVHDEEFLRSLDIAS